MAVQTFTPARGHARSISKPLPGFNCVFRFDNYQGWVIDHAAEFAKIAAAGFKCLREVIEWRFLETAKGVFDWTSAFSNMDRIFTLCATHDIEYIVAPWGVPQWANGTTDINTPPTDFTDFADFCVAVAQRYGAGGTFWTANPGLTPKPLVYIELGNEPWLGSSLGWSPDPNPTAYAAFAREAATALKAAVPSIKPVLIGDPYVSTSTGDVTTPFLGNVLAADPDLFDVCDAVSLHPYANPRTKGPYEAGSIPQQSTDRVTVTRDAAAAAAGRPIDVLVTEYGATTNGEAFVGVTEDQQADFFRQMLQRVFDDWSARPGQAGIVRLMFHAYMRDFGISSSRDGHYGVMHSDGTNKPAWIASQSRR